MSDWLATAGARRFPMLGTWVDAMDQGGFFACLASAIEHGSQCLVANHNVNSLAIFQTDGEFRRFYARSDLVYIDGMPVVFMARALGYRVSYEERLAVLEWFWPLLQRAADAHWRVVHLGSHGPVIDVALRRVHERCPDLDIVGLSGFFDHSPGSPDNRRVIDEITGAKPDVLLVGMGMPLQERWVLEHLEELPHCVIITVGGILGFIGGERATAPRWMGRLGIEWMFRLVSEPRRLWHRYLVEPWVLVPPFVRDMAQRHGWRGGGRRA